MESGDVRVLAILSDERVGGPLAHVPTAREQGIDVSWIVWRGFYVPTELESADYARWSNLLETIVETEGWQEMSRRRGLTSFSMTGPAFERFVREQLTSFEQITAELGLEQ